MAKAELPITSPAAIGISRISLCPFGDHLAERRAARRKDEEAALEKQLTVMDGGGSAAALSVFHQSHCFAARPFTTGGTEVHRVDLSRSGDAARTSSACFLRGFRRVLSRSSR